MRKPKCPSCGGTKVVQQPAPSAYDDPHGSEVTTETCGECIGTGKDLKFLLMPHPNHVNPLMKERT